VTWRYSGPAREWEPTEICLQLEWRDGQTIVLFKHAGWVAPVEFMHHCSTKWATFLLSLKACVETGEGRPEPSRDVKIALNGERPLRVCLAGSAAPWERRVSGPSPTSAPRASGPPTRTVLNGG
jgi:hypothetical protein